jgi:hypothetical protein
MVKAEEETLLTAGNIFQPTFLDLLRNFRMIRAVQWLTIDNDGGLLTNWSQRPLAADGGWGGHNGVPLEIVLQLCNAVLADCWLNVPHAASDDFIIQMARLVHTNLGASQKVFVEYSNEVWNTEYAQYDYAKLHGMTLWPTGSSVNGNWYGMRAAQTCDMWKSAWGTDASRVVCVMGAQAANVDTAIQALNCPLWIGHSPCARHGIDVVAIAPYINVKGQTTWTSDPDGGLASLFLAMNNTGLPVASRWEADYRAALIPFKIPYIAYESGQSLVGFPTFHDGSAMVNLYIAANRDSRMGAVYASMLNDWRSNGGQSIVIYADIYPPNQYGEWGAVESSLDVVDPLSRAPPKWLAIQTFINTNRCWWPNCRGTIGADSKALPKPH